jgi:hypothetical protein
MEGGLEGIMPRDQLPAVTPKRKAWNKGRIIGHKRPLCRKQVCVYRQDLWGIFSELSVEDFWFIVTFME